MYHKTFKCAYCDFTYVWENTLEDNKIANDHTQTHPDRPLMYSYVEVEPEKTV